MKKKLLAISLVLSGFLFLSTSSHAQSGKEKSAAERARTERDNAAHARDKGDVKGAKEAANKAEKAAKETSNKDAQKDAKEARQAAREAERKHGKDR